MAPHYVFDEHVRLPDILVMSAERWRQLSPEAQGIIEEAANIAVDYQRELWRKEREQQIEKLREEGVTFTRPDKEPFVEATQSIYEAFEGTEVMDYVERIRTVRESEETVASTND